MHQDDETPRRFYAVRYEDDIPVPGNGKLIPYIAPRVPMPIKSGSPNYFVRVALTLAFILGFSGIGLLGFETATSLQVASLPSVTVVNPFTKATTSLQYGTQVSLAEPHFFAETRDAFIAEAVTFIEADLTAMQLRYFRDGVLEKSFPIKAKGKEGSWWETPAGLYSVEFKKERHFSSFGEVYQPWNLGFQGNFFIHGWPEYPDGTVVSSDFSGGCIRLETEDAKELYELVKVQTPILVHELEAANDTFLYEPKVPTLDTPHYLIADIGSNTVLAATDLDAVAPIASITKLMTALIAAEYINLDSSVSVTQPHFVQSLIPRLSARKKVSMYSLLQLLLVESSNEAADVIANQLGRERFIELMNKKAVSLGMSGTRFADPSGLSAENLSTVGDLMRLSQYIYTNRSFILELTAKADVPTAYTSGEFGELVNFNLIEGMDHFIGGKVGETLAAGQTSVSLHRLVVKGHERILAIVLLGSHDRSGDVTRLYSYAKERFGE